jgi:hypothetical protein
LTATDPGAPVPVMITEVAFAVVHVSTTGAPEAGEYAGLAENERICTGAVDPLTVTVTAAVTVVTPSELVAVRVYVVVAVGETFWLPLTATLPTPLLMLTVAAPVVVQDSREDWPALMVVGEAAKRMIAGFVGAVALTVTVTLAVTDWPPAPVAVKV